MEIRRLYIERRSKLIFRYNFKDRILTSETLRIIVAIRNAIMKWRKISWRISKLRKFKNSKLWKNYKCKIKIVKLNKKNNKLS